MKNIELNTQDNRKISLEDFTFSVTIVGGDTPGGDTPGGDTPDVDTSVNALKVSDVSMTIGENQSLEIMLDNESTNLMGWQCDISLPEGLTLELKTNGKPVATLGDRFTKTGHTISSSCLANGDYRFIATSMDGEAISGTSGTLFSVTLKADASLTPGTKLTATVKNIEFNTQDNRKISLEDFAFSVTITGGDTPGGDTPGGDTPGDDTPEVDTSVNALKVSDVNLTIGEDHPLGVLLENETTNLMGWQCDISLPEGLTLELKSNGKPVATLGDRFTKTGHTISSSCLANGDYRFIATSMDGEAISGTSGTLFSVTLKADASLTPGTKLTATVKNIEFNTQDNQKLTLKDVEFLVVLRKFGDVNGDGEVDALDVEEIVNALMGKPSENYNPEFADVNNDQKVNAADIVTLVNIIKAQ